MKKVRNISLAVLFALSAGSIVSCKDNKNDADDTSTITTDTESTTTTDTEMSTASDTATVVNDTNVSGTTSGKMEQVP